MDHKENSFNINELHTGAIEFLTLDEFTQKTGVDKNLLLSMKNNGFLIPSKYIEDVEFYSTELFNSLSQKISNFQKVIPTEHDLTISQLARKSGIDEQTLFLMEKEGFIKGRTFDGVHYYKDNILSTLEENHEAFDSYMSSHYNEDGTAIYDEEDDYFSREERDYNEIDEDNEDVETEDDENSFDDDNENYLDEYRRNMTRFHGQNMSHSEKNAQKADSDAKIRYKEEAERTAKRLKEEQERNNRDENYTHTKESVAATVLDYEINRRITEEENRLRAELDKAAEIKRIEEYKKLQAQAKEYEEKTKKLLSEESFGKQGLDFSGHGEHYNSEYESRQREIKRAEEIKHSEEAAKNYNSSIESEKQRQRDYQENKNFGTNTHSKPYSEYNNEIKYKESSDYQPMESSHYDSPVNSQNDNTYKSTNYEEYPKYEYSDSEYKPPEYKQSEYKEPEYKKSNYKEQYNYQTNPSYAQPIDTPHTTTEHNETPKTETSYKNSQYEEPKHENIKYKDSTFSYTEPSPYNQPSSQNTEYKSPVYEEPIKYEHKSTEHKEPIYKEPKQEESQYKNPVNSYTEPKTSKYETKEYEYKTSEYKQPEHREPEHRESKYERSTHYQQKQDSSSYYEQSTYYQPKQDNSYYNPSTNVKENTTEYTKTQNSDVQPSRPINNEQPYVEHKYAEYQEPTKYEYKSFKNKESEHKGSQYKEPIPKETKYEIPISSHSDSVDYVHPISQNNNEQKPFHSENTAKHEHKEYKYKTPEYKQPEHKESKPHQSEKFNSSYHHSFFEPQTNVSKGVETQKEKFIHKESEHKETIYKDPGSSESKYRHSDIQNDTKHKSPKHAEPIASDSSYKEKHNDYTQYVETSPKFSSEPSGNYKNNHEEQKGVDLNTRRKEETYKRAEEESRSQNEKRQRYDDDLFEKRKIEDSNKSNQIRQENINIYKENQEQHQNQKSMSNSGLDYLGHQNHANTEENKSQTAQNSNTYKYEPTEYTSKHKDSVTKTTPVGSQNTEYKTPSYTEHKPSEAVPSDSKSRQLDEYIPRGAALNESTEYVPKHKESVTKTTPIGSQNVEYKIPNYTENKPSEAVPSDSKSRQLDEYIPRGAALNESTEYMPKHKESIFETTLGDSQPRKSEHNKEPEIIAQNSKQDFQVEYITKGAVANKPTEHLSKHKESVADSTPIGSQNIVEHKTPAHTEHKQSEAIPSNSKSHQPDEYVPRGTAINESTEYAPKYKETVTKTTPVGSQTHNSKHNKEPEFTIQDSKQNSQAEESIPVGFQNITESKQNTNSKSIQSEVVPSNNNRETNKYTPKDAVFNESTEYIPQNIKSAAEIPVNPQNTVKDKASTHTKQEEPKIESSGFKHRQSDEYIPKGAVKNEPKEYVPKHKEIVAETTPFSYQSHNFDINKNSDSTVQNVQSEHHTKNSIINESTEMVTPHKDVVFEVTNTDPQGRNLDNNKSPEPIAPNTQPEYNTKGSTTNEPIRNATQHKEIQPEITNMGYQTNSNHYANINTEIQQTPNLISQKQIDEATKNIENLKTQVDIHSTSVKNAQNSLNDLSNRASNLRNEIQLEQEKLSQFKQNDNFSTTKESLPETKEKIQRSIDSKKTELKLVEASISSTLKYIEKTTEKINDKQQEIKNKTNKLNTTMEQYNVPKLSKNTPQTPSEKLEKNIETNKTKENSRSTTTNPPQNRDAFSKVKQEKFNEKFKSVDTSKPNKAFNPVAAAAFVANQAFGNEKLPAKTIDAKYKLTDKTKVVNGVTLYQIEAIRDFGNIKKGMPGGWVEGEHNLSQEGTCWISNEAIVMGNSRVEHSAIVKDNAILSGNVKVSNNARIIDSVTIHGKVDISDKAFLSGNARISNNEKNHEYIIINGNSRITDRAVIRNNVHISDKAVIGGQAVISNNANIGGNTRLLDHTNVIDDVKINGDVIVQGNVLISGNTTIKGKVTINPQNRTTDALHIENRLINGSFNITNRNELNEHSVSVPKTDKNGNIINEVKNYGVKGTKKVGDASLISTVTTPKIEFDTFKVNPLKDISNSTPYNTQLTKTSPNNFSVQSQLTIAERQKLFAEMNNNNNIKLIESSKSLTNGTSNELVPKNLNLSETFLSNETSIKKLVESLGSNIEYQRILIPNKTVVIHRIKINQDTGNYKAGTILTFANSNDHETLFATMEESIFMDNGEINPDLSVSRNLSDKEIDSVLGNTKHSDRNNQETIKFGKSGSPAENPLNAGQEKSSVSARSFYQTGSWSYNAGNKQKFKAFEKKLKQIKKNMHLTGKVSRTIGSYVIRNNGLEETEPMQFVHLASAYTAWITATAAHSGAKELAKIEKEMIEVILLNKGPKVNLVTSAVNFKDATKRLSTKGIFNDSLFVNYNSALSLKMYKNYLDNFGKLNGLGELTKLDEKQLIALLSNKNLTKDQIKAINAAKDLLNIKFLKKNAIANVLKQNNINFGFLNLSLTNINSCRQLLFMIDKHQLASGSDFAFRNYSNKQLEQIINGKLLRPNGKAFTDKEKELAQVYLHGRKKLKQLQEAKQAKSKKFGSYMRLISSVLRGSDALEGGLMIYRTVTTAIQAISIAKFFAKLAGKALLRVLKYTNKNAYKKVTNVMETSKKIKKDIKNTLSTQKETVKQAAKDLGKDVGKLAVNKIRTSDRFIRLKNSRIYNKFKKPAKFAGKMGKGAIKAVQTIAKPFKLITTGISKISSFISKAMTKVILIVGGLLLLILLFIVFMSAAATITSTVTGWFTDYDEASTGGPISSVTFNELMDNHNGDCDTLKEFDENAANLIYDTTEKPIKDNENLKLDAYKEYLSEEQKGGLSSYIDPITGNASELTEINKKYLKEHIAVYNYYNGTLLNQFTGGSWKQERIINGTKKLVENKDIIIDGEDKYFDGTHKFEMERTYEITAIGRGDMIPIISNNKSILIAGYIFCDGDYGEKILLNDNFRRKQYITYCQNTWKATHQFIATLSRVFCTDKKCKTETIKCYDANNSSVRTKFENVTKLTNNQSLSTKKLKACNSLTYHSISYTTNSTTVYCGGWHRKLVGSSYKYIKCTASNRLLYGVGHTYNQGSPKSNCDKLVTKTKTVSALAEPTKNIAKNLISEIETYFYGYEYYFFAEYYYDLMDNDKIDKAMNKNMENVAYLYNEAGHFGYNISGEELLAKIKNGQKYYEGGKDCTTEAYVAFVSKLTNYKYYELKPNGTISSSKFTISTESKTVTYKRYECQGYCPGHTFSYCTGHLHIRLDYHVFGMKNIEWDSSKNCFVYTSYSDDDNPRNDNKDYNFTFNGNLTNFFNETFTPANKPSANPDKDFLVDKYPDYEEGTIREYFTGWDDNNDGKFNTEDSNIDWAISLFDENWFDMYSVTILGTCNKCGWIPDDFKNLPSTCSKCNNVLGSCTECGWIPKDIKKIPESCPDCGNFFDTEYYDHDKYGCIYN